MVCPRCNRVIFDGTKVCPYCHEVINETIEQENNNLESATIEIPKIKETNPIPNRNKKYIIVFILLIIIITSGIVLFKLIHTNNPNNHSSSSNESVKSTITTLNIKETLNVGKRTSYSFPAKVNEVALSTIKVNNKNYYVDVYGLEFKNDNNLYKELNESTIDGFVWKIFTYKIKLNDLKDVSDAINPVLKVKIYQYSGCDFVTFNQHNYELRGITIYSGEKIKNTEEATISVLYQVPQNLENYSVCLGENEYEMACFTSKINE